MKILILSILISASVYAQTEVIISSAVHSVISGYTMRYQFLDREAYQDGDPIYKHYSRVCHGYQTAELVSAFGVGFTIALDSEMEWDKAFADLLIAGAMRWTLRDGTYQLLQGNSFWNLSDNSMAQFEHLGLPVLKIAFLVGAITFRYLLE